MRKPLILSLETSTRPGGVAVLRGDQVLAEKTSQEKSSHSAQLLPDLREVLHESDVDLKQIELIAVAIGPGSFTGLRIGLSTAKALAAALKIPIAGVSTMVAAANICEQKNEICVVLPAGRNEYFVQTFDKTSTDRLNPISRIEIFNNQSLADKIIENDKLIWTATEEIYSTILKTSIQQEITFQSLPKNLAASIGQCAHTVFMSGKLKENLPHPIYVRGADVGGSKNAK